MANHNQSQSHKVSPTHLSRKYLTRNNGLKCRSTSREGRRGAKEIKVRLSGSSGRRNCIGRGVKLMYRGIQSMFAGLSSPGEKALTGSLRHLGTRQDPGNRGSRDPFYTSRYSSVFLDRLSRHFLSLLVLLYQRFTPATHSFLRT